MAAFGTVLRVSNVKYCEVSQVPSGAQQLQDYIQTEAKHISSCRIDAVPINKHDVMSLIALLHAVL